MNILEQIVACKTEQVRQKKLLHPVPLLERSEYFRTPTVSMKHYLSRNDKSGIIAEFKRKSPSKGLLNKYASVEQTSIGYMQAGASALSVLTDEEFFAGSNNDLVTARQFNYCPILRKDFIIDEYQVTEARSIGADAVLLIAAILPPERVRQLAQAAKDLGLEVILEIHSEKELDKLDDRIDIVGVNNRDLQTFVTDVDRSLVLFDHIPDNFFRIAESGIDSPDTAFRLLERGFDGLLIGEHFMRSSRPEQACAQFIHALNNLYENQDLRPEPAGKY